MPLFRADKTAFRKLGQITSYRQIGRQIAGRWIDRLKVFTSRSLTTINIDMKKNMKSRYFKKLNKKK